MVRATTEVILENNGDLWEAGRGELAPTCVRREIVSNAVVDADIMSMLLPLPLIRRLGLSQFGTRRNGTVTSPVYWPVRLTMHDRSCSLDVLESPDGVSVIVGWIVLLQLDLVIDPSTGTVTGNPAHGGEQILELYLSS